MVMRKLSSVAHAVIDVAEVLGALLIARPPILSPSLDSARVIVADDEVDESNAEMATKPSTPPTPVSIQQWGLQLPNGNIIWDNSLYRGHPLATPEQREVLVHVLAQTANDLDFETRTFLSFYGWARREGVPAIRWGTIAFAPLVDEDDTPDDQGLSGVSEPDVPK